tara:strand:+ start:444 stop:836 length:393 start_codon:yes stop_codon:yes gene_type:complete
MPKYPNSSGEMIDKKVIDRRIAKAKDQYVEKFIDTHGFLFCERLIRSDLPLDRSHVVSVKYCQEHGKSELAWDLNNIELLCRAEHLKLEQLPNKVRESWYNNRKNGMTWENFLLFNNIDIQEKNNLFNNQ